VSDNNLLQESNLAGQPDTRVADKLIYLVAGEDSGDILGADLMRALKVLYPQISFKGIGGPLMEKQGLQSFYPYQRLAVIGIVPIFRRYFELVRMRKRLRNTIVEQAADCFIGIDAPVFNTELEYQLTQMKINCVHYVSPSVWAWRENRIHKIIKSVSLMLCLFPFELAIYKKHGLAAINVGHPLADDIPIVPDQGAARQALKIDENCRLIALLPGSRISETKYLVSPFIKTAQRLQQKYPELRFILPCATQAIKSQIENFLEEHSTKLRIILTDGDSRTAMLASDFVLLASGTASLEATLLKKPMVVAYKLSNLSYFIYSKLLKITRFSLPNLLSGKALVKEFIQSGCTVNNLSNALLELIEQAHENKNLQDEFISIHKGLRQGGSKKAAQAIYNLLEGKNYELPS